MNTVDLFAGVGGIRLGLEQAGFNTVYSNDFNKHCKKTFDSHFGEDAMTLGDITKIDPASLPDHDVLTGGFPCQAFSVAGKRMGFNETRGTLFFNLAQILDVKRPKAFLFENVKGLVGHDGGKTIEVIENALDELGYHHQRRVLNSWDYGVPQNRERVYIVGFIDPTEFNWPEPLDVTTSVWDILEEDADPKYDVTNPKVPLEEIKDDGHVYQWRYNYVRRHQVANRVPCLVCGQTPPIINYQGRIRKLTPLETFRVQGFPSDYKIPANVGDSQLYKQTGNSVSVPVIKEIGKEIWKSLNS